jgi:hypothetical protein
LRAEHTLNCTHAPGPKVKPVELQSVEKRAPTTRIVVVPPMWSTPKPARA